MDDEELEEVLEDMEMSDEPWFNSENGQKRNIDTIARFLGKEKQALVPITFPAYYRELLAWALQRYSKVRAGKSLRCLATEGGCHDMPM